MLFSTLSSLVVLSILGNAVSAKDPSYDGKSVVWEGETFTITCRVPIHQRIQIQWSRNGVHFSPEEKIAFLEYDRSLRHPSLLMNPKPRENDRRRVTVGVSKPQEYLIEETLTENEEDGQVVISKLTVFTAKVVDTGLYRCVDFFPGGHSLMVLSDSLQVDDVLGNERTLVQFGYPLRLLCNTTNDPVKWYKDDSEVMKTGDGIEISSDPNQLTVNRVAAKDGGNYKCSLGANTVKEFIVEVEPHVKFPAKSVNAIGGEKFELKCEAAAYPAPTLTWKKDDIDLELQNASSRYSFGPGDDGLVNAVLKINVLEEEDGGMYTCIADSNSLTANSTVLVRVKDKWAALYPFIGIVIEVIILVSIIFIYEKKRSKDRQEEEDDHGREKSAINNKDSEVRHRK